MTDMIPRIEPTWVELWGRTLVHFCWQACAIGLAVAWLLHLCRHARPQTRYCLSLSGLLLLAAAPLVTLCWLHSPAADSGHGLQQPAAHAAGAEMAAERPRVGHLPAAALQHEPPPTVVWYQGGGAETTLWAQVWSASLPWLLGAWLLGVFLMSLRLAGGLLWVARLTRVSTGDPPARVQQMLDRQCLRLRVGSTIRLLESALVHVPTVVGVLRPVLLVPSTGLVGLNPAEVELLLAHELAHIRRHDYLWNLLQVIVETFFFFHPVVWWLSRRARIEREQCCDELAVDNAVDRRRLAAALLRLVDNSPATEQLAMAGNGGELLPRVRALLGVSPSRAGRSGWLGATLSALVVLTVVWVTIGTRQGPRRLLADEADAPTPSFPQASRSSWPTSFLATGRVTVEETGRPVPGVKLSVVIGNLPGSNRFAIRDVVTDDAGDYIVEIPPGHGWFATPQIPPGYWRWHQVGMSQYAASPESPVVHRDFEVHQGEVLAVRVRNAVSGAPAVGLSVSGSQRRGQQFLTVWNDTDHQGRAELTLPAHGGELEVHFLDLEGGFRRSNPETAARLTFAEEFRPDAVVEQTGPDSAGVSTAVDRQGRQATIEGGAFAVAEGRLELQLEVEPLPQSSRDVLTGQVLSTTGQPLAGAQVVLAYSVQRDPRRPAELVVSHDHSHATVTDATGTFRLPGVPHHNHMLDTEQVAVVVTKPGYVGQSSPPLECPAWVPKPDGTPQTIPPVRLAPAVPLRLRVVGPDGGPLAGAWVKPTPGRGKSNTWQAVLAKSDAEGRCDLDILPAGVHHLTVTYGELTVDQQVVITETGLLDEVIVRPQLPPGAAGRPVPARGLVQPLEAGAAAATWQVADWSDGQPRTLAQFRGQVVVLDFWGVWCSACLHAVPTLKQLMAEYEPQGVVFLGMHTPGTQLDQIQGLLQLKEWSMPTALDVGDAVAEGATARAYGVLGYPTLVVIDPQGRVAYNSSAEHAAGDPQALDAKLRRIAEDLDLAWPIDPQTPREEARAQLDRMHLERLSRIIEAARQAR